MDLLLNSMSPAVAKGMRGIIAVFSGSCFLMVAWYGIKLVLRNHRFEVNSAAIGVPMWLVYLPIPVFSVLIALRFFASATRGLPGRTAEKGA